MKTNAFITLALLALFSLTASAGDAVKETEFKVFGNWIPAVKFAKWDKKSKMLKIAYLPEKITLDSLQHLLASVGHDAGAYKAADAVYESLPACCLYRGADNTH